MCRILDGLIISMQCLCRNLAHLSTCIPIPMSVSVQVLHEPKALRVGIQTHRLPLLGINGNQTPFPVVFVKPIGPEIKQLLLSVIFIRIYTYLIVKSIHKLYPMRFKLERWGSPSFFRQLNPVIWFVKTMSLHFV